MQFDLKGIHKANAVVDRSRLDFFNGEHIKAAIKGDAARPKDGQAPLTVADTPRLAEIREAVMAQWDAFGNFPTKTCSAEQINALLLLQCERVHHLREFSSLLYPFMATEEEFAAYFKKQLASSAAKKLLQRTLGKTQSHEPHATAVTERDAASSGTEQDAIAAVSDAILRLNPAITEIREQWSAFSTTDFSAPNTLASGVVSKVAKAQGMASGTLMLATRFMLTGLDVGASFADTLRFLGRETTLQRLQTAQRVATEARSFDDK